MNTVSNEKNLLISLGFTAKENSNGIYQKKYADNYTIEIDFVNEKFNYGNLIQSESKTTQNFSQKENWVVLECVDRLLVKGYKPNHITLEKVFPSGHGTSGRLDILVSREDETAYMMIECKTWGSEFEKEFKNLNKDGGQLFTYFQQDNNTDILVLYASRYNEDDKCVEYTNQIVKVEEEYRAAGNVKDFYDRWNKLPKNNGIFENVAKPYGFVSKALTRRDLKTLKSEDSSFIFNRFLEILRHNVVSDKPNAFNKIFTLFLCKIIDETRTLDEELHFQWLEGKDTSISFQKRLSDLYTRGMKELLEKEVTDVSDSQFDKEFQQVDDLYRDKFKDILTEIRLKKNNEFAIKEVYDDDSFNENAIVVKEIVELLQNYQIRYNYRQQFLSDFFELLLTTGLKQESGQFFTPVPVARFVIRSIPFVDIAKAKIEKADKTDLLPVIIDYSAGSGHFITESMEELQNYIDTIDESKLSPVAAKSVGKWKVDQFDWAEDYVYAIEKDYRLVKTAKVSCYLHGDGLAKVIHGDGLADFTTAKEYKDKLKKVDKTYPQDNKEFDIIVSNPPYSVSAFKGMMESAKSANNFELYSRLTDQSSEIEALFIERTKQLLKDGGVAGIILPSSILNNAGIYSDAREIILKYFDIIGITELGSNTFMATGTNTVVLFLRRRNNADHRNIKESIAKLFENKNDITINGVETPLSKYLAYAYEGINKEEYFERIEDTAIEQERFLYFIIAYPQKVVIVKTGSKNEEKRFLGYEFSTRRGREGIHPIQRDKTIDECTMLYDPNSYDNALRASSYIYSAYCGQFKDIDESLKDNVSYVHLVDMLDFEYIGFKNTISLNAKKKVVIESQWELVKIGDLCEIGRGRVINKQYIESNSGEYPVYSSQTLNDGIFGKINTYDFDGEYVTWTTDGIYAGTCSYRNGKFNCTNVCGTLKAKSDKVIMKFLPYVLNQVTDNYVTKVANPKLMNNTMSEVKIPLPPLDIQQKIVEECESIDNEVEKANDIIKILQAEIVKEINGVNAGIVKLISHITIIGGGTPKTGVSEYWNGNIPWLSVADFNNDSRFVFKSEKSITQNGLENSSTKILNVGDIIISARGTVGALAEIAIPMAFNQSCYGLRPDETIISGYLYYILKREVQQLKDRAYGMTFDTITTKTFESIKIPLPSIDIQKQIVAEIEIFEAKIAEAKSVIESANAKKEAILKKYL